MSRQDVENGEKLWLEAFNSGDAAGVAACYTERARVMPPNSPTVQGRTQMREFLQEYLDAGAQLRFELLDCYETPQVCVAVGSYELDLATPEPVHDSGRFVEVWQHQSDGSWLISEDIFNSSLPVPA